MKSVRQRERINRAFFAAVVLMVLLTLIPLFLILGTMILKGAPHLSWEFFTRVPPSTTEAMLAAQADTLSGQVRLPGGIVNGIAGTLIMTLLAALMAIPVGLLGGIYLSEKSTGVLAKITRFSTDTLQGVPSIVIGIIVYAWVVKSMGGYSALAGAVALAIMMLPLISRATEETLNRLPRSLKESALALGCSYTTTVLRILLPSAKSGLLTGILLALSRVMGETAPLMMTALGSAFLVLTPTRPMSAVPLQIWEFYNDPNLLPLIWSSSLFLLLLVLTLNLIAKRIASSHPA